MLPLMSRSQRSDPIGVNRGLHPVKAQNKASDLGAAQIQNCNHTALHCRFSHGAHGALGFI